MLHNINKSSIFVDYFVDDKYKYSSTNEVRQLSDYSYL